MAKRGKEVTAPRLRRPSCWSKAWVLEQIASGRSIRTLCSIAASSEDSNTKADTLYTDIRAWQATDPDFAKRYDELVTVRSGRTAEQRRGGHLPTFDEEAQEKFLAAMITCNGRVSEAAAIAEVSIGAVYAKMNPRLPTRYDPVFAERFHVAESYRLGELREQFIEHAKSGGDFGEGDPWAMEKILAASMPHLHNPKIQIEVDHQHTHTLKLDPELLAEVQARSNLLLAHRRDPAALPDSQAGVVIDVPVAAREEPA